MGYDLIPRNKKIESFYFSAFSWPWMLEAGVGLVIGTGGAMRPASYSYRPDKRGRDPNLNDGFYVTATQARAMAMAARGLVSVQTYINKEWEALTESESRRRKETEHFMYKGPIREDFVELARDFAKWAERSRGFWVR